MSRPYSVSHARIKPNVNDPNNPVSAAWDMVQESAGVVSDLTGGGNDFELFGNPMQRSSLIGNCLGFNGVGQYGKANAATPANADFSVAMWMKAGSLTSNHSIFSEGNSVNSVPRWYINTVSSGTVQFLLRDDANVNKTASLGSTINDGLDHLIVAVRDGDNIRVHVDEEVSADIDISAIGAMTLDTSAVGCLFRTSASQFYPGNIGATAVLPFAVDSAWIASEYARSRLALWKSGPVATTGNVTSGYLGDSPFRMLSGTAKVSADTFGSESITRIENVSAGNFYIPTSLMQQSPKEAAAGYVEYTVKKADIAGSLYIQVASNNLGFFSDAGNYSFFLSIVNDGSILVRKSENTAITILGGSGAGVFNLDEYFCLGLGFDGTEGAIYVNGESVGTFTNNDIVDGTYQRVRFNAAGDSIAIGSPSGKYSVVKRLIG